ncbi:MAG: type III pantothenate kinase, partial [Lachnospiraceae bacterium]|nr:type III pantothenate kinase [Lachnospiraceae bacterium]
MILVIDVGNTNITFGVYKKDKLVTTFRMMSGETRTSDEYGMMIKGILSNNDINVEDIDGAIIASVVPNLMHALTGGVSRYIKQKPMVVGPGTKTGIKIITDNPREIGADRIVDAVGAY